MFSFIATHVNGHFYSCVQKGWRSNFPCGSGVFGYTSHQFEFHTRIIIQCATNCNLSEIYFCAYFDLEFADALIVTFNLYYLHYLFFFNLIISNKYYSHPILPSFVVALRMGMGQYEVLLAQNCISQEPGFFLSGQLWNFGQLK